MSILIPLVSILGFFAFYQKRNHFRFGPISLILSAYIIMAIVAAVMHWFDLGYAAFEIQAIPMLYLSSCLLFGFWGFNRFTDRRFRVVEIENLYIYRFFELFLIVTSLGACLFFLPWAIHAITGDVNANRLALSEMQTQISSWGYINTFFSLTANLFALNFVCAFIGLNPGFGNRKAAKLRTSLLLVGSTSYIIYILAYVGRDGTVFWAMTFWFVYLLLRRFISVSDGKVVRRVSQATIAASLVPFVIITIARFTRDDTSPYVSIVNYSGAQLQQFNDHFIGYSQPLWGQMTFPIVTRLLSPDDTAFVRADWFWLYTDQNVMPWTFSTYVGTFLQDFGPWITPLIVSAIVIISRGSLGGIKRKGKFSFSQLCVFILCSQIIFYGVFYFRQALVNVYLVAIFALALIFRYSRMKRSDVRVIEKIP